MTHYVDPTTHFTLIRPADRIYRTFAPQTLAPGALAPHPPEITIAVICPPPYIPVSNSNLTLRSNPKPNPVFNNPTLTSSLTSVQRGQTSAAVIFRGR